MFKTIGLFAHVDSGKTSLAEQILYETNAIRTKGRVDHQNTFLDHHSIEKQEGSLFLLNKRVLSIMDPSIIYSIPLDILIFPVRWNVQLKF